MSNLLVFLYLSNVSTHDQDHIQITALTAGGISSCLNSAFICAKDQVELWCPSNLARSYMRRRMFPSCAYGGKMRVKMSSRARVTPSSSSSSHSERVPVHAMDQAPSPPHSTLELIRHDASAGAPERDNAIVAPENARDQDAPQVCSLQKTGQSSKVDGRPRQRLCQDQRFIITTLLLKPSGVLQRTHLLMGWLLVLNIYRLAERSLSQFLSL